MISDGKRLGNWTDLLKGGPQPHSYPVSGKRQKGTPGNDYPSPEEWETL